MTHIRGREGSPQPVVTAAAFAAGIVLAATAAASPAWAQEDTDASAPGGLYFTAGGSLGAVNDPQTTENFDVDLGSEIGLFAGLGYGLGLFRVEAQLLAESFQVNNLNPVGTTNLPVGSYTGNLIAVGLMANAFVNFPRPARVRPYLGIGGGVAYMTPYYRDDNCFIFCTTGTSVTDGSDTVSAWQGMAGITVPSRRFGGEWDFGYRHFATNSADFRLVGGTPFTQDGIRSHSFQIGYRHYFGGPAE